MLREYMVELGKCTTKTRRKLKEWRYTHALTAYHQFLDLKLDTGEYVTMYEVITTEDTGDTVYRILEKRGR